MSPQYGAELYYIIKAIVSTSSHQHRQFIFHLGARSLRCLTLSQPLPHFLHKCAAQPGLAAEPVCYQVMFYEAG